jgi:predicted O-linked N-acetylglucosamine transferase (SPINDLY family)
MSDNEKAKALFFEALDLIDADDFPGAEAKLRDALRLAPGRPSVMSNLAVVLLRQRKLGDAAEVAQALLAVDPANVEGWLVLSLALKNQDRLGEALEVLTRAASAVPDNAQVRAARGSILATLERQDAAIADFEASIDMDPDQTDVRALLVQARMQIGDWAEFDASVAEILDRVRRARGTLSPFILLGLPSTPADQMACATAYCARHHSPRQPLYAGERYTNDRIRLAYVSGDFRAHALSFLMAGIFERHDRSRFEVLGISTGPDDGSPIRARVAGAFDRFVDAQGLSVVRVHRRRRQFRRLGLGHICHRVGKAQGVRGRRHRRSVGMCRHG